MIKHQRNGKINFYVLIAVFDKNPIDRIFGDDTKDCDECVKFLLVRNVFYVLVNCSEQMRQVTESVNFLLSRM